MRQWIILAASALFSIACLTATAQAKFDAGLINVNFGNKDLTQTGKAVLGTADTDKWNSPDGAKGDKVAVTDAKGEKTDATITYDAAGVYDAEDAGFVSTPWENLLRDYLYATDAKKLTIAGLTPSAKYDLVLYSASNMDGRKTKFTVGKDSDTVTYAMEQKELVEHVNYSKFTATADAEGNVVVTFEGVDGAEGNFNGFQISPVAK
jgi:hypothetical protein